MSNMSYCRFENTHRDLMDCKDALETLFNDGEGKLSDNELRHAKSLIQVCKDIVELISDQDGVDMDDPGAFNFSDIDAVMDEANDKADEHD